MKKKVLILLLLFTCFLNINIFAASNTYYNKYYNILKDGLLHKKTTIKLSGYDYSKFDLSGTVKSIMTKYKNAKYIVSEIKYVKKSRTLSYVYIKYKPADYIVNNRTELENILTNLIRTKTATVSIKINNYNSSYNFKDILHSLDLSKSRYFVNGFSYKLYQLKTISNQVIVDFSFKYVDLYEYKNPAVRQIARNKEELYSIIKDAIYNFKDRIDIKFSDTLVYESPGIVFDYIGKVLEDNGDLYYLQSYGYLSLGPNVTILIKYTFPLDVLFYKSKAVEDRAKEIIGNIIKEGMSDYEKELAIHDYLVNNIKYDYQNVLLDTVPADSHNAYGALIKGIAVCDGYTTAYNILLRMAGVENKMVFGYANGIPHTWNLVKLDGQWYHVDVTFDDPVVNGGTIDVLSYRYFNITDNQILLDHSFDRSKYPVSATIPYTKTPSK